MLELDGSEGGGQLFRSALTLSALTGNAFEMTEIRGSRPEPGLEAQHLTTLETLQSICDADVEGATVGATTASFDPNRARGGHYRADIGTAGSLTLLFDAILPLVTALEDPLAVTATGGTDVKWSPPMAHLCQVKLPVLFDYGVHAAVTLDRTGFYPRGDGRATLTIAPSTIEPFALADRGSLVGARVYSKSSLDLQQAEVADRQAGAAVQALSEAGIEVTERTVNYASTRSTGSAIVIRLDFERSGAGASALGERKKPAEAVGEEAVEEALGVRTSGASVDVHLADQLVPFLAHAGGTVTIPSVSEHVVSHVSLLEQFDYTVDIEDAGSPPRLVADRP
ncbi:MAG: RNA 3'-terminal phosphate cyclase [archaeon]